MGKLRRRSGALKGALALVLALALPASAAPRVEYRPAGVQAALDWFGSVIDGTRSGLAALWAPDGEGLDPDGEPTSTQDDPPTGDPELGGGIDPGGCRRSKVPHCEAISRLLC